MPMLDIVYSNTPVAFLCEKEGNFKRMLDSIGRWTRVRKKNVEFVQLFDSSNSNLKKMAAAYIGACLRQRENALRSDSIAMEMLLLMAGRRNTKEAIDIAGAKEGRRFILFSTSKRLALRFAAENMIKIIKEYRVKLDLDSSPDISMSLLH